MTTFTKFIASGLLRLGAPLVAALLLIISPGQAQAQASGGGTGQDPIPLPIKPNITPQSTAATQGAARALGDGQRGARSVVPGVRAGMVTEAGSGRPVGEGSRVLTTPGKCTPKTNSLDCVNDSAQTSGGANVSGRVRNSVIGEVGAGKAATEGGGKAKTEKTCVPAPGRLTCEP